MVREADIVKQLRNEERLGLLKNKNQSMCQNVYNSGDYQSVKSTNFINVKNNTPDSSEYLNLIKNYESLYKSIFENCSESIIIMDTNGIIKSCNFATFKMFGYSKNEIIGKSFYEFVKTKEKDNLKFLKIIQSFLQEGETETFEFEIHSIDGSTIFVEIQFYILRQNNKKIGIQAIIKDITVQKMKVEELKKFHKKQEKIYEESNLKLQKEIEKNIKIREELLLKNIVFESSSAANSTADVNGVINFVNNSFLELWGYDTKDEVIGKPVSFFFKNEQDAASAIDALNKNGKWEGEFVGKRKNRTTFLTKGYATIVRNEKGEMIGYYSTNLDFSEQKKKEEELIKNRFESEEKYKALFKACADGILIVNIENKKLQFANPAFLKMFGYDENEISKLSINDIHPKASLKFVFSKFEDQIKNKKTLAENIPCLKKDGTIFYADINAAVFVLNGKKYDVGFFRDTTVRKKTEQKLKNKIEELERWKKVTIGRELEMKKLKEKINQLKNK